MATKKAATNKKKVRVAASRALPPEERSILKRTRKAVAAGVIAAAVAVGVANGSPAHQSPTHAVMPLRDYQHRWVNDHSRFKIAVKSARIGFSFATALEAVLDCIEHPGSTWTVLSASKAQSVEFIKTCSDLLKLIQGTVELYEDEDFWDELGKYEAIQQRVSLPNGARIIALAANARTARGYPGNAILDEFAHHDESYAIWAAITRQVSLGHKVRILSTPNGEQGKFYDICKELGLTEGEPEHNFQMYKGYSIHWINVEMAVAQGCPINIAEMRQLIQDEDIIQQEFYCVFLKSTGAWLPIDLIQRSESAQASMQWPSGYTTPPADVLSRVKVIDAHSGAVTYEWWPKPYRASGNLYGGIDVGRVRDRTTMWIKEDIGSGVLRTIMVIALSGVTFPKQAEMLAPFVRLTYRTALDSTGMGIALFDLLNVLAPGRVMAVNFAGSSRLRNEKRESARGTSAVEDGAVNMKTDLAIKLKRSMESDKEQLPYNLDIRTELQAIKRVPTATGVTFDAPRVMIETGVAGGPKQKGYQHADHFWGCALATYAAQGVAISTDFTIRGSGTTYATSRGIL
jgi:phage FluMu gp28-like protein